MTQELSTASMIETTPTLNFAQRAMNVGNRAFGWARQPRQALGATLLAEALAVAAPAQAAEPLDVLAAYPIEPRVEHAAVPARSADSPIFSQRAIGKVTFNLTSKSIYTSVAAEANPSGGSAFAVLPISDPTIQKGINKRQTKCHSGLVINPPHATSRKSKKLGKLEVTLGPPDLYKLTKKRGVKDCGGLAVTKSGGAFFVKFTKNKYTQPDSTDPIKMMAAYLEAPAAKKAHKSKK